MDRHQRAAVYRCPGIYGFTTPVNIGPFSTLRRWNGFELPAMALTRDHRRCFSRAYRSLLWLQRLKCDDDLDSDATWPLVIGHVG